VETKALKGVSPLSSSKQQNKPFPVVLVIGLFSLIMLGGFLFLLFAEVPINGAPSPILDKASQVHPTTAVNSCNEAGLQNAISSTSPGGTVTFSCSGTITITSQLVIDKDLTLDGSGQTVSLDGQNSTRIMTTTAGINLTINSLTLTKGKTTGNTFGAGIYKTGGTLTISNTTFSNNTISDYGGGAGIYNSGGTLNVNNSTFSDNYAFYQGGGIFNTSNGIVTVANSHFSTNYGGYGGGIFNITAGSTLNISTTTFSDNSGKTGGGIAHYGSLMTVTNSTFSGNSADGGGGIVTSGITTNITNSTFFGNSAADGGGVYANQGTTNINNSTFSNNSAQRGGGINVYSGILNINNSTFSANIATNIGGGIYRFGSYNILNLKSSLVANNSPQNCSSTIIDQGYNLEYTTGGGANTCGFTNNAVSADPLLDPAGLQNNGGPTKTIALQPGSPAIGKGSCFPPNTDQRGLYRKSPCDIGAFESNPSNPLIVTTGTGNGTGSLADALQQAGQLNSPVTIIFQVNLITITTPLTVPNVVSVTIEGGCNNGVPQVQLQKGAGYTGNGLILSGKTTLDGLIFSGFDGYGLEVQGSNNTLTCNRVGTVDGTTPSPNGSGGIHLTSPASNTIMGKAGDSKSGNLISGNSGMGLLIEGGSKGNIAYYTLIGYKANGQTPLPNSNGGLKVLAGGQLKLMVGNKIHQ